jgi:hypothetical protein
MSPGKYPDRDPQMFYELARDRLSIQLEAIDAVDNKIGLLASLASALMGILAAVVALRGHPLHRPEIVVIVLSAFVYVRISIHAIRAYFSRSWKAGPELTKVWALLWSDSADDLVKWKVARAFWESQEINETAFTKKANVLPLLLVGVVIQTVLLGALALVLALGAGYVAALWRAMDRPYRGPA